MVRAPAGAVWRATVQPSQSVPANAVHRSLLGASPVTPRQQKIGAILEHFPTPHLWLVVKPSCPLGRTSVLPQSRGSLGEGPFQERQEARLILVFSKKTDLGFHCGSK